MHTSEFFEQTTIQDPWSEVPAEDWNNWKWQLKTESPLWAIRITT